GDDFNPILGDNEAAIFKVMYMIYYYDTKIRENLGAAAVDSVVEISEGGALVRLVSKNNIALSYIQQKRLANEELNDLVAGYRTGNSIPRQVVGDDTKEGYYNPTSLEERAGT
ncbi:MAG: hypothetical protein Q8O88_04985, partial [bacterium]|nr:hypothetical protein [bacterium]